LATCWWGSKTPPVLIDNGKTHSIYKLTPAKGTMGDNKQDSSNADSNRYTVSESKSIRQMTPNQFYKVCPTEGSAGFGPPMCGDGTPFCFFVSRSRSNTDKLLVEIMGGGACWDEETCNSHSELLTFPEQFDGFLGLSCSEIQVLGIEANGKPINMLCADTLGETDLTQYNSIMYARALTFHIHRC
jgi:hypothetical protein